MAVIYLQDANPWGDFGTALGTAAGLWGANRLGEIDATRKAKKTAYNEWGKYAHPAQSQSELVINTPQATPETNDSIWREPADEDAAHIGLWKRNPDKDVSALNRATTTYLRQYAPNLSLQTTQAAVNKNESDPYAAPDKATILDNVRNQHGQEYADYYVDAIKGGATQEEAKVNTMALMQGDVENAYNTQLANYRTNVLDPMRDKIIDYALFNTDDKGNKTVKPYDKYTLNSVYPAVMKYNEMAAAAGEPTIDINGLNALIQGKKEDYQYKAMPNGDYVQTDLDSGAVKTLGNYAAPQDPRKNYIETGNGLYNISTGQIVEGTQKPVRESSDGGGGGGSSKPAYTSAQINAISKQHSEWCKAHPTANPTSSPYYAQLMEMTGGSSSAPVVNRGWLPKAKQAQLQKEIITTWKQYGTKATVKMLNDAGFPNYVTFVPKHNPK